MIKSFLNEENLLLVNDELINHQDFEKYDIEIELFHSIEE